MRSHHQEPVIALLDVHDSQLAATVSSTLATLAALGVDEAGCDYEIPNACLSEGGITAGQLHEAFHLSVVLLLDQGNVMQRIPYAVIERLDVGRTSSTLRLGIGLRPCFCGCGVHHHPKES
jgi:hypothetical protein